MIFKIVTFYDEALARIGDLTSAAAEAYARRHGYEFTRYRTILNTESHIYWNKLEIILREITDTDYTLWLDADALIVGNEPLDSLVQQDASVWVSCDADGPCCGVMMIKNSIWSHQLLRTWLFLGDVDENETLRYEPRNLHDQTALKCLLRNFPNVRREVKCFPQDVVLNPKASFCTNPFIMHYWSSSGDLAGIERRIRSFCGAGWSEESFYNWNGRLGSEPRLTSPIT